jgi:hypothetical protein
MKRQFVGLLCLVAGTAWAGTEGNSSTYYGNNAGATQGAGNSGLYDNTFIGANAGYSNTIGHSNTFLGEKAGSANTEGSENVFLGWSAGTNNTAQQNTFVGASAGYNNTSGPFNTFLGSYAGLSSNTGSYNTFLGAAAGATSTEGLENTFVGAVAGGYSTGSYNTFLGRSAGADNVGSDNTFVGYYAGAGSPLRSSGDSNTYVGEEAGLVANGSRNTMVGMWAGREASTGDGSVFIGYGAGYSETNSNRLYIDACYTGEPCNTPLVYGEFDNNRLRFNGMTEVHYNGQPKSQLNFSANSTDTGGYLTSVLDNNFFASSGARYDGTLAPPNQWMQRSADGNSVIAGSGGAGYRIFTSSGNSVDAAFTPTVRLHINYAGEFGINQAPVAGHEIHTSSGAYLASGTWTNASSRELKDNIRDLPADAAAQTLASLRPVTFNYKTDTQWQHVGFIAEDVPDLVASPDRKGLSPMDIVAVLTKVVQEQNQRLQEERSARESLKDQLRQLAAEVERLKTRSE